MAETPCEVKRWKGASPMDGARVTLRTDAELERPPGAARQAVGVSHAESWRRSIYASCQYIMPFYSGTMLTYSIALPQ